MSKTRTLFCSAVLASSLLAVSALAGETLPIPQAPPPAPQSIKMVRAKQQTKNAVVEIGLLELIATLLSNLGMSLS